MKNYKAVVAYDGTAYVGWQTQDNGVSIQQLLEHAFYKTFGMVISLRAASRTDAGVHAHGQIVQFMTNIDCSVQQMLYAWNNALPTDIVIISIDVVPARFHPWYNVEQKIYWYQFFMQQPLPFVARYGWFVKRPVNMQKLQECLQLFCGTHDFTSFVSAQDSRKEKVYTIQDISLEYEYELQMYRIIVTGKKFMRHMIRRIVGASLYVSYQPALHVKDLENLLHEKNPNHPYISAPAQGLTLKTILYKDIDEQR